MTHKNPKDPRNSRDFRNSGSPQKAIPPRVKMDAQGRWTLVPPHCVFELEPDLADVEMLMQEEDFEAARDAALFILEECQDMTPAHLLLGNIAEKEMNDMIVAQAHYGYVFEITLKWLGHSEWASMNGGQKINRISLEAAEGLKRVLEKRGEKIKAEQVGKYIVAWKTPPRPAGEPAGERVSPPPQQHQGGAGRPQSGGSGQQQGGAGQGGAEQQKGGTGQPPRPSAGPPKRRPMMPRPTRRPKDDDSK